MGGSTAAEWPPSGWFAPQRISIDAGAATIAALVYDAGPVDGDDGSREPIVVLHGWADSAWSMDGLAQALARSQTPRRVISLDMRGHGHSDRGPYNMVHLVGDVRGVFETLELDAERPIVIGHSLGGQVLGQFSGIYPELVRALVMIEGVGPPPHRLAASDRDGLERIMMRRNVERSRVRLARKPLSTLDDAAARLLRAHPMLDGERARFLAERNTVRDEDGALWWRFDPASRDWLNGHSAEVAAQRWRGITCPVLVVNGSDSFERYWQPRSMGEGDYPGPLTGDALDARLANFADVRYVEIAGGGHMLHYDKPSELHAAVRSFIGDLDADVDVDVDLDVDVDVDVDVDAENGGQP